MNLKVGRAVTKLNFKYIGKTRWADFAKDFKLLADKAFPKLKETARAQLAINSYLEQLDHPRVVFGIKQKSPQTIDEAIRATLEMENFLTKPIQLVNVTTSAPTTTTNKEVE